MKKTNDNKLKNLLATELWMERNPQLRREPNTTELSKTVENSFSAASQSKLNTTGISKRAYYELTSSRNRNLIKPNLQHRLRNTHAAFFGLSVGSHAAMTWMMLSRAETITISDPDIISATNLNRLRCGWNTIGKEKVEVVKDELLNINPFAKVLTSTRIDKKSVEGIFSESKPVHIVVESIDDMKSKIWIRKLCRSHSIPLISAADVGDNVMLDIERYDIDNNYPFFHGRVDDIENLDFDKLSPMERKRLIIRLVGFEHNSEDMIESLFSIGGSISTWPQLGSTATIAGGVNCTTIKKIITGEDVKSGRYYVPLDNILDSSFSNEERVSYRSKLTKEILKSIE